MLRARVRQAGRWCLVATLERRSGIPTEGGRVKVDQVPAQDTEAAKPAQNPDRIADVDAAIAALVRLLARQAAREHLERLANPELEATNES
jgi:hypothetical protein